MTPARRRPLRLGLTGNIGSGKSTVAALLMERGAALVDADALAREAVEDPEVLRRIAVELGEDLVQGGRLDRPRTAARVFGDAAARQVLNGIVHPWVRRRRDERLAELEALPQPPPVVILDIPLLYENGLERECDAVLVVDAPLPVRIARVRARSGLSEAEIRARDAAQLPLAEKVVRADFVVYNGGPPEALAPQLERIWRTLLEEAGEAGATS